MLGFAPLGALPLGAAPRAAGPIAAPNGLAWPALLAAWNPPDPLPDVTFRRHLLSPGIPGASIDRPPVNAREASAGILAGWTAALVPPPPTLAAKLPAAVAAVSADPSPANLRTTLPVILVTWVPPDPLPARPSQLATGAADLPPFAAGRAAPIVALRWSWTPPDPQPAPQKLLAPGITAVRVDEPPYSSRNVFPAIEPAWRAPDPLPTIPIRYQPMGIRVDDPPRAPNARAAAALVDAWQARASDPQAGPLYLPRWLTPGIPGQSIDGPPARRRLFEALTTAWWASEPAPTLPRTLPGTSVDFVGRAPAGLIGRFEPADPLPILSGELAPGIPGQSADTAPGGRPRQPAWPDEPGRPVQLQGFRPEGFSLPFARPWTATVTAAWTAADPRTQARPLQATGQLVDNPPGRPPRAPPWTDLPPPAIVVRPLSPGVPGQSADNPPPGSTAALAAILRAAEPIVVRSEPPRLLAPGIPGQSGDRPPPAQARAIGAGIVAAWVPADPAAVLAGKAGPGIPGRSADNPPAGPPRQPPWIELPVPLALASRVSAPVAIGLRPPAGWPWLATVVRLWALPEPPPQVRRVSYLAEPAINLAPLVAPRLPPGLLAALWHVAPLPVQRIIRFLIPFYRLNPDRIMVPGPEDRLIEPRSRQTRRLP